MANQGKYAEWLEPEKLTLVQSWARDGLTNEEIATKLGIYRKTLYLWIKRFPELAEAIKKGKEIIDYEVEETLLKRAMGYKYVETTRELVDGKLKATKEVEKEMPPETTAIIFWLKNRKPEIWNDRREYRVTGNINNPLEKLTTEELKKLAGKD